SQCIAIPVAQREEKRHFSLYMGLEADVALDCVGPLRTPGLDCLLPLAAEIFLDCVAHQARLMHRFTFRLDTEPSLTVRRVANILHLARPAILEILGRWDCKANMRFASEYNAVRSNNRKNSDLMKLAKRSGTPSLEICSLQRPLWVLAEGSKAPV